MSETRHLADEGKLVTYPNNIYAGDTVIVDTASGSVRIFGQNLAFQVAQVGSRENSWLLIRNDPGPIATALLTLTIAAYRPAAPFMFSNGATVHTGNCAVVK